MSGGCGCGGASNVYRPAPEPGESARGLPRPQAATGLPKVWNGPAPKAAAAKQP